jgi:hypothetical protein
MVGAGVAGGEDWARIAEAIRVVSIGLAIGELDSRILAENPLA